jgi:aspartyl-tRNA(Asn)/glutamyl-tRNA(Gln) amidotransferase subunit A
MSELIGKSIGELKNLLKKKEVSARQILDAHLDHCRKHEPEIQAFNCITDDLAIKQAKKIDDLIAHGQDLPPLGGIPIAVKDAICVSGYPTTCSSKILENFSPPYEATVIKNIFNAGALCVGKTNMDEFGMGSSTENSAFKITKNPWDTSRVPGGSSGGSAAAVAAGFSTIALGEDTGGSIRQPASMCGVVGIKPTYGTVSRFGVVAYASSLDQIGAFGRNVQDVAITLAVLASPDSNDSTCLADSARADLSGKHFIELAESLSDVPAEKLASGLKIGIISELTGGGIDSDVNQAISNAAGTFTKLGASVDEVSIPHAKYALPVYYIIAIAEASANLARYDGVKYGYRNAEAKDILSMYNSTREEGFGAEVKRRIMLGTYALSSGYYDAYYKKAQQVRRLLKQDFDHIFEKYDLLICPVSPSVAFQINEKMNDPLTMYLSDIATIPLNLAGLPGISVPGGFGKEGLPIGLQILGKPLSDGKVLKAASAFEKSTEFHTKYSPFLSTVNAAK